MNKEEKKFKKWENINMKRKYKELMFIYKLQKSYEMRPYMLGGDFTADPEIQR